jgi:CTD small phosphatase-like protein 2
VIFDIDETLVHCGPMDDADFTVEVMVDTGEVAVAGVKIRPGAIECLRAASKLFEVMVFTASHQTYAD